MQKNRNNKAFTLTELVVTMAAIALLVLAVSPVMFQAKVTSKRTLCQFNLKTFSMAAYAYSNSNDGYFPAPTEDIDSPFWMTSQWSNVLNGYISGEEAFICPSVTEPSVTEPYGSYAYSMSAFYSPQQINTFSDSDMTVNIPGDLAVTPQHSDAVASPDAKIIFGEWYSNHSMNDDENGWWNFSGKRNFSFADGHTNFIDAEQITQANDGYPDANVTIDGIKGIDYN